MENQNVVQVYERVYNKSGLESVYKDTGEEYGILPFSPSFEFCNGKRQSPIAINSCTLLKLPNLVFTGHWNDRQEGFQLTHEGTNFIIKFAGSQPTIQGGPLKGRYVFEQLHFHWGPSTQGSEHQIFGRFYGLEMHLVHYNETYGSYEEALTKPDGLAIITVMFEINRNNNPRLDPIIKGVKESLSPSMSSTLPGQAFAWLAPVFTQYRGFISYEGSITEPPCRESAIFIIISHTPIVGTKQLSTFRSILNAENEPILNTRRALQPLNNRKIVCSRHSSLPPVADQLYSPAATIHCYGSPYSSCKQQGFHDFIY